jgi:hypothetical protein
MAWFIKDFEGCNWVSIRCSIGTDRCSYFTKSYVSTLQKYGTGKHLRVFGWAFLTGKDNPKKEGEVARAAIEQAGADGLIVVLNSSAETDEIFYEKDLKSIGKFWEGLTAKGKLSFPIGYSADSNLHVEYPTKIHGKKKGDEVHKAIMPLVDFYVPRIFWHQITPTAARVREELLDFKNTWLDDPAVPQKPVSVLAQGQGVSGSSEVIAEFCSQLTALRTQYPMITSYNIFRLDSFSREDAMQWRAVPSN